MAECVKVVVRCRPMNSRELAMKCCSVVDIDSTSRECSLTVDEKSPRKRFTFDGAYDAQNNTEQIYSRVIYPLVESVLEGYNGTIFAYGQTGSGKSYSMQGVKEPACDKGVIPRAFDHIFENILASEDSKFLVHASYLEIYNEEVRDLLAKDVRKKLDLKEDFAKGIYVNGLSMHQCNNQKACEKVMQKGWSNRSVGGTLMNAESSRSHSIFTIHLERSDAVVSESENTQPNKKTSNKTKIRVAKLNLIDLAGSERQGKTGASGVRLKEATKINLSLSALGNVISALVDGKCSHVPFRDSKLTRLLQDSLGGNTKTLMLACLSPADNNADETLSTLRYANRAKSIKNKPKINEDPKDALIRQFQEEILKLKELLAKNALPQTTLPTEAASTFDRKMLSPHPCGIANEKKDNDVLNQKFQKEIENSKQELLEMKKAKRKAEERFEELNKMYQSFRDHKVVDGDGGEVETADVPAAKQKAGTVEKNEKKELSGSELKKALLRIEELESKIVRGEEKTKEQMKLKKEQRKQQFENDKKMLMEVIKHESEDDVMVEIFGNTCEKLKHMKDVADKQKSKIDTLNQDLADLKSEFEEDRADYLDTIRGCEKDNSWLEAVLAKVLPLVRKNCNYCNLDKIKHDSSWDDLEKVWSLPPLLFQEVRLPDPPPSKLSASSHPIRSFCVALSRGEENVNMQNKMADEEKNSLKNKKNNEKTVFVGFEKLSDKKTDFPTTESFRKSSKLKPLKLPRMK